MRKRLVYNISFSFLLEIVSLICAFILPRLIITSFGSEYNGIVSSITQFLSVITLLRGGIGGVARAALYKPLVDKDFEKISSIINATERYMRKISYIFLVLMLLFASSYPLIVSSQFEWLFTFSLVIVLSITSFSQYYFGITYQILLQADQRGYIYSILQTIATIINTILTVLLVRANMEFRLVKLVSSLVFAAIPIALYWYVHRKYKLYKNVPPDSEALSQRWQAFAHQVAAFINTNTDLMVLTLFSDLYQVSIYSVYFMVVNGIKKFVTICTSGVEAALGKTIADDNSYLLSNSLRLYELVIHIISVIGFSCVIILIIPFMQIYMYGVTDTNYIQPLFGTLLSIALFISCIRLPYQNLIDASGHFKQTKTGAIIEAGLNIVISCICVKQYGCIGVAIGTIVASLYRTIELSIYAYRIILNESIIYLIKRFIVSSVVFLVILCFVKVTGIQSVLLSYSKNYTTWIIEAIITVVCCSGIVILFNFLFFKRDFKRFYSLFFVKRR